MLTSPPSSSSAAVPRAPGEPASERASFADVVLVGRLQDAIQRLNPQIPQGAQEEALRKVVRLDTASFIGNNRTFHKMLRDGVEVEYSRPDGSIAGDRVRLVDFARPAANDWFAVNQFTVIESQHNRRPDVVVFVNGLPLAIIELKMRPMPMPRSGQRTRSCRLTKPRFRHCCSTANC